MARFVRCIEGHVFDAEATGQCPMCGAALEVAARPSEPVTSAPAAAAPAATHGSPMVLAIAVLGVGLGLAAAATVIWLRPGAAPAPVTQATQVAAKDDGRQKPEGEKPEAKTEATPANRTEEKSKPPESSQQSQPSPAPASTNNNAAPLPNSTPTPAVATPLSTPVAPTLALSAPALATPVSAPLPSTSTTAPANPALSSLTPEAAPEIPGSPAPANTVPLQADLAPIGPQANPEPLEPQSLQPVPPSSFGAPPAAPVGPVGGRAFKAAFEEALGKLTALGPVQPDIGNIATALVGHELLFHEAEETGIEMLRQAAAANIPFAAADLGVHYFNGSPTARRDFEQARRWLDVATLADIPVANYELAVMYIHGLGVKRDPKLSGHYLLAAYHGGYPPAVEIIANARAGHRRERELMREIGLDPVAIGMTVTEYYNARRVSDPQGARTAIEQLAHGLQWPASRILGIAQWKGEDGPVDRAAAVKNFLIAARGGDFGMLTPIAEASLDGTLGPPNPVQAGIAATLLLLYGQNTPVQDIERLQRISQNALDKAGPEQRTLLVGFKDLLSQIAPAQPQANSSGQPIAGR